MMDRSPVGRYRVLMSGLAMTLYYEAVGDRASRDVYLDQALRTVSMLRRSLDRGTVAGRKLDHALEGVGLLLLSGDLDNILSAISSAGRLWNALRRAVDLTREDDHAIEHFTGDGRGPALADQGLAGGPAAGSEGPGQGSRGEAPLDAGAPGENGDKQT